jgi:ribose/xylose/arabinose/galactoside ABC-type transport system permease subunit
MTYVITTGGIDLSVGAIVAFSGVITTSLVRQQNSYSLVAALAAGILIGALCGAFSGFFVAKLDVPPFVVTLATMTIARGFTYVYTSGKPITGLLPEFIYVGAGSVGILPIPVLLYILVIAVGVFFLNFTKFGRYVFAVGGNEKAAIVSGIKTSSVKFGVYLISGICSAIAGIILAARIQTGQPASGMGYELDAITAVVIGGASLSGGVGSVVGSVIGMLIIGIMTNGLDLLNVSSYYQQVIKGIIILIAVLSDKKKRALTS